MNFEFGCDHMFHSAEQYSNLVIGRLVKCINSQIFQTGKSTSQLNCTFYLISGDFEIRVEWEIMKFLEVVVKKEV